MGSLFKAREPWTTNIEDDKGFDTNSLLVANIDNSKGGDDKIIVGGLSGFLRIFNINHGLREYQAGDLLLESDLSSPILQISSGLLLATSDHIQLAVLHPRKVSVFSVTDHGSSYSIHLVYEHILSRSSFNMVIGPFGGVKNRDFMSIQSLDGTLSFYEQETFAFSRFLPNYLLPGPIEYNRESDSFIVATSSWTIESYRYQIVAISTDEDNSDNTSELKVPGSSKVKGRRVTPDWTVYLGEMSLDLKVVYLDRKTQYISILGEKNLFILKETGIVLYIKKLDFTPSCFFSYMNRDQVMSLVVTESKSILIFANHVLKWAAHMSFTPIAIRRGMIAGMRGIMIALSDEGELSCSYLGTNPSLNVITFNSQNAIGDYAETEKELQELRKQINTLTNESNPLPIGSGKTAKSNLMQDLRVRISEASPIHMIESSQPVRRRLSTSPKTVNQKTISYTISLEAEKKVSEVRISIESPTPLKPNQNVYFFPMISEKSRESVKITFVLRKPFLPPCLRSTIIVMYNNSLDHPRIITKSHHLPLGLLGSLCNPLKETDHSLSLDVVCSTSISLKELFVDLFSKDDQQDFVLPSDQTNIGVEFPGMESVPPVSVSLTTKSPQQKFRIKSDSFPVLAFVSNEVIRRLQTMNVKFDTAILTREFIPMTPYLEMIDRHFDLRRKINEKQEILARFSIQYRTVEKRFLIKLKDRNPAPLNHIDLLLEHIFSKIQKITEELVSLAEEYESTTNALSSCTNLILTILSIGSNMKQEQISILRSNITTHISSDLDEGWEERTEVSLMELLKDFVKEISAVTRYSQNQWRMPEDTTRLKSLLTSLVDHVYQGDVLSSRISPGDHHKPIVGNRESPPPPGNQMAKGAFLNPRNEIIPEEDEEDQEDQNESNDNNNKGQSETTLVLNNHNHNYYHEIENSVP